MDINKRIEELNILTPNKMNQSEAARVLGVSRQRMKQIVDGGLVRYFEVGGRKYIKASDLRVYDGVSKKYKVHDPRKSKSFKKWVKTRRGKRARKVEVDPLATEIRDDGSVYI